MQILISLKLPNLLAPGSWCLFPLKRSQLFASAHHRIALGIVHLITFGHRRRPLPTSTLIEPHPSSTQPPSPSIAAIYPLLPLPLHSTSPLLPCHPCHLPPWFDVLSTTSLPWVGPRVQYHLHPPSPSPIGRNPAPPSPSLSSRRTPPTSSGSVNQWQLQFDCLPWSLIFDRRFQSHLCRLAPLPEMTHHPFSSNYIPVNPC